MVAWVIKNNDDFYWNYKLGWCFTISFADIYPDQEYAIEVIKKWRLRDCKPVKVRIEEI